MGTVRSGGRTVRMRALVAGGLAVAAAALATVPASGTTAPEGTAVIVRATSAAAAAAAVRAAGGTVTTELAIVHGVAAEVPAGAVAGLDAMPGVSVSEDGPVQVQANPSPLHAATAVYPKAVGADRLWREGVDGDGVTVAVIDTGIAKVPDLANRVVGGVDLSGEDDPYRDSFGHGTFVAGLIAGDGTSSGGAYKGVAPDANLVSVKIAGRSGAADVSHVLAALQWVVSFRDEYGIRVVNLSLGTDSTQPYLLSPLDFAVERAWANGIVVVVSSSNNGPEPGTVTKPGDDPFVVTVGATDDRGTPPTSDDLMAGFSGAGPTADGLNKPDIVAPGRSLVSLRAPGSAIDTAYPTSRVGSAYFKGSGTSFSAGVVSGAAALLLHDEPALDPDQVKHRLLSTAAPAPVADPNVVGKGALAVDAAAAATTLDRANQGVIPSLGVGSLDLDRGTLGVRVESGGSLLPIWTPLTGLLTAQLQLFDAIEYLTTDWAGSRWYDAGWYGSRWYGSRWYGSRWYGSQWAGSRWYATDWSGSRWYGSRWYDTGWYGSRWYGIAWE